MNERIEEFAKDCKILGEKEFAGKVVGFNYKKFAELIVGECFVKLTPYLDDQFIDDIESELKEHFGVEE